MATVPTSWRILAPIEEFSAKEILTYLSELMKIVVTVIENGALVKGGLLY